MLQKIQGACWDSANHNTISGGSSPKKETDNQYFEPDTFTDLIKSNQND